MKVLLLGVGMQGKAALHDLIESAEVNGILAADVDLDALRAHAARMGYDESDRLQCIACNADDSRQLRILFEQKPDVVIDLLPVRYCHAIAQLAIDHQVHLVNTVYVQPEVRALGERARARGVTILPEFGLDPGIDLVLLGEIVRSLDQVDTLLSYGAGLPEPAAATPPLRYRVTWTFAGVLRAYRRNARLIRDGVLQNIPGQDIFATRNIHALDVDGLGRLEAYPNGDAIPFAELAGLDPARLRATGRYALRWPGHSELWRLLGDLHLMDDEPVFLDGTPIDRRGFLAAALEPHLALGDQERDLALVRIEATGRRAGTPTRVIAQMIDWRDLTTGLTAMSRTVGFTASIGAHLIHRGALPGPGILSPVTHVPWSLFAEELRRRGITATLHGEALPS
jgi:lysine 6-dehydrogenase